jgi:hypothetical protein
MLVSTLLLRQKRQGSVLGHLAVWPGSDFCRRRVVEPAVVTLASSRRGAKGGDRASMPKGDLRANRSRLLEPLTHHQMIATASISEPIPTRTSNASRARVSISGAVRGSHAVPSTLLPIASTLGSRTASRLLAVASSASRSLLPSPSASPHHDLWIAPSVARRRSFPRSCSPPHGLSIRRTYVHRPRSRAYGFVSPCTGLWLNEPPTVVGAPGGAWVPEDSATFVRRITSRTSLRA